MLRLPDSQRHVPTDRNLDSAAGALCWRLSGLTAGEPRPNGECPMNEDSDQESREARTGVVGAGTSRRGFLKQIGALGALGVMSAAGPNAAAVPETVVPRRRLGRTGEMVGMLGLGCIYFRAVEKQETDAIIRSGLDLGVNFIEWGPVYGDAQEKVASAIAGRRIWRNALANA